MPERRRVSLALLLVALTACGRQPSPGAATTSGDAGADEGPRIATSPDNVHVEYRVYGHGEPAVLLVHGWANDADYWHAQLDVLKARYTVVALNLAGHGASGNNRSEERRVGKEWRSRGATANWKEADIRIEVSE